MHYIQSYILDKLVHAASLRNRDMRPPNIESNLYQYHLTQLQREGYVAKADGGYTLTGRGLAYADLHSATLKKLRPQPKLITVLFVTNEHGELLLKAKYRQPFIGLLNLPSGKLHRDESLHQAAARELREKVGDDALVSATEHFGVAHMTIMQDEAVVSDYIALLVHVPLVRATSLPRGAAFYDPGDLPKGLMPSVAELVDAFAYRRVFSEAMIRA